MLSPSRAPHSMKKPSRLPWIRIVLQIPWLFFITLNISATLPCSPHWPSKGFLLANGLLLSIWLKLYLCLWSQKVFLVSLIFAPSPNWTMQTVPIRHFGGNFLVWLCIFYVEDTTTRIHIEYVCGSKYHTVEKGWVIPDAIMADTTIYRRNVTTWRILDKFAMDSCQKWPLYWKYFQELFKMIPLDICLVDLFAGGLISLAAMSIPLGEVISCNLGSKGCWYKKKTAAVRTAKVKGKRYHLDIALEIWKYYMIRSLHYVLACFYHTTLPGQLKTTHHWWIHS